MNNSTDTIRKFNRFELKYLITLKQAEQFRASLSGYMIPDVHGDSGSYTISSLYYDSPDLRCYHEKEDGLRFRRKLRIRRYENGEQLTELTPVFVEIKQRVDRVTQKRRAVLTYGDALRLCNDRSLADTPQDDRVLMEEMYTFLWQYNLRPTSIVRYNRKAYNGSEYDAGLRITFDTNLSFQTGRLHLHEGASCLPMLSPNVVVMEIKVNERIPNWLTAMIASHNFKLERISKYCRSITAAQSMPVHSWRMLPAENSESILASTASAFSSLEQRMGICTHSVYQG